MTISRRAVMASAAAAGALSLAACNQSTPTTTADALGDDDATGIAQRIARGEITAAQALEAAIARAEAVNPQLNFMATPAYDYGRARAAQQLAGPFAGVPTLIKDLMNVTGLPTKYGSRAFAQNVADAQPAFMDNLLAAGLVPFGKSATPEFGLTATTEPLLGGPTKNPWNVERSCGGSSGGAAVAVASRVVPIAHASDGGGSIRIPASCNGLLGLKPSRGRTVNAGAPERGISLSVNGCVSRSVRDTAAWLAVVEASGEGAAFAPVGVVTGPNTQRLRITLATKAADGGDPDADVLAATQAAAELCRRLGHTVTEGAMPVSGPDFSNAFTLLWAESAAEVVDLVRAQAGPAAPLDQLLEPLTLQLAELYHRASRTDLQRALTLLTAVEAQYEAFFANTDILLTPVLSSTPPRLGEIAPTSGMEGFAKVARYVGYTPLQNVAGAPAMSVPLGMSADGLPIGAHFAAAKGQEKRLLELAYELESAQPWASRKPGVNAG
ncbi:amidase [Terricaulis sp.]|uniref:amidase n=1 Tax=Terricaulis sp. TaxID=2768686 RepID=UPI0037837AD9